MTDPEDRPIVDLTTVLLTAPVLHISLPGGPANPGEQQLIGRLIEQSVTMAQCMVALRPVIDDMKFEYEAATRSAGPSGSA
jgi:hypothetical protein